MNNGVDMHCHSLYSDGNHSVDELIKMAIKNGVDFFSVTDHDDIRSTKDIKRINRNDIAIVNGLELSTVCNFNAKEIYIHLLAYDYDPYNSKLLSEISRMKEILEHDNFLFLKLLQKSNIRLPQNVINQLELSNYMWIHDQLKRALEKSKCKQTDEILNQSKRFIPSYDDYEVDIYKAIDIVLSSGGIPVLAHPSKIKISDSEKEELIKKLSLNGLMGIESSYSYFNAEEFIKYSKIAKKYGLLESVGSDFHFKTLRQNVIIGHGIENNLMKEDCSVKRLILERNR